VTFTEPRALVNFDKFDLTYDKDRHELRLTIPSKKLSFKEEGGMITADFDFAFYVYKEGAAKKEMFVEAKSFRGKAADLEKSAEIAFTFDRELPLGKIYVDAVIDGKEANGKSRKIFKFNI